MGDVVNLNKFRKSKTKDKKENRATENRQKFGQPKAEKIMADTQKENAKNELDGKKLDDNTSE